MTDVLERLLQDLRARGTEHCLHDGAWHGADELIAAVREAREVLAGAGLPPASVVALPTTAPLPAIARLLAAWQAGLVAAMLPPDLHADDTARHCQAAAILDDDGLRPLPAASAPSPLLRQLADAGGAGLVLLTSGSTGRPKAALHSAQGFLAKFARARRALRTLTLLRIDHVAGLDTLFYTLAAGGSLVLPARREPEPVCALLESTRAQVLSCSPSFLRLLWASGVAQAHDLSSLQIITYGSEPMDATTLARVHALLPAVRLSQKYGTTETGAPRTASRSSDSTWVRFADEGVETQVRDGILWLRTPGRFLGYLDAPPPLVDAEGWYCTGDAVDQDGEWLRIRGRAGEVINVGGEKVSPLEVEQAILQVEGILDAVVHGRADPLLGQVVAATVTLKADSPPDVERRVRRHCRQQLPPHGVPVTVEISPTALTNARQKRVRPH